MSDLSELPNKPGLPTVTFRVDIPEEDVSDFKELVRLSKLGPKTYENLQTSFQNGVTYEWMKQAKDRWETKFDWRKCEERINTFPQYKTTVTDDDGEEYDIHYVAMFSQNKSAIPVVFTHGWPGSFLEFLDLFSLLHAKHASNPEGQPYHLIAPSLPGYTFSSSPSLKHDFLLADAARLFHKLLTIGLGFNAYAVQGGDIGASISRILAATYKEVKCLHLNFGVVPKPDSVSLDDLSSKDRAIVQRTNDFAATGSAYAVQHGTRASTIGFTLSASPLALLAWIGEKFVTWSDEVPSLDTILESVTLYWLTETFPRAIWPYRQGNKTVGSRSYYVHSDPKLHCHKPFAFSAFPKEIYPMPKAYIETTGDLVYWKEHDRGGHFAALEQPQLLADDVEAFLTQAWKK